MKKINVLNGESLKEYFEKKCNMEAEEVVSFNECLADGTLHEDIFSEEFFSVREKFITESYRVSEEAYKEKSVKELKPLLKKDYDEIILWFDYDMFCQVNMLVVLAYLDFHRFHGRVTINIIHQHFFNCSSPEEIIEDKIIINSLKDFYSLYFDILIEKNYEAVKSTKYKAIFELLPWLKDGIALYIKYTTSNSEIKDFISERRNKVRNEILVDLMNNLNKYGLSDTQYKRILDDMGVK